MSDALTDAKRGAAIEAAALVRSGMVVGLGTGSTAAFAIEELGRRVTAGELENVLGIPTSNAAHRLALEHGLPLTTLEEQPAVDVTIDGADEIDPLRRVLKGAGGALLREKIVASRSAVWVLIVDPTKLVDRIGSRYPLPVEVVAFGWRGHFDALRSMGAEPALRMANGESPYRTDEGHHIIDARFPHGIADPESVARALRERPGVVETGLFLGLEPQVVIGRV